MTALRERLWACVWVLQYEGPTPASGVELLWMLWGDMLLVARRVMDHTSCMQQSKPLLSVDCGLLISNLTGTNRPLEIRQEETR